MLSLAFSDPSPSDQLRERLHENVFDQDHQPAGSITIFYDSRYVHAAKGHRPAIVTFFLFYIRRQTVNREDIDPERRNILLGIIVFYDFCPAVKQLAVGRVQRPILKRA